MAKQNALSSGVTAKTPKAMLFGAGTVHKGLKYTTDTGWNFKESLFGATSDGNKLSIKPEITDIELDGVNVKVKGLTKKVGETASLETSLVEITPELIAKTVIGKEETAQENGFKKIISKPDIEEGDYIENFALVCKTLDGKSYAIILFKNALCTSGLELEGKAKEGSAVKSTFECYADLKSDLETLPYEIIVQDSETAAAMSRELNVKVNTAEEYAKKQK